MRKLEKLVLIGIDSLMPNLIERFVGEGRLKEIKELMDKGAFSRAIPSIPINTGCNWATIATGANTMTHGCSNKVHYPGDSLEKPLLGFSSEVCKAEQIWEVAEKAGKKTIIFDYPQSWPPRIKNLIHIGESGCPDYHGYSESGREIAFPMCYSTEQVNKGAKIELKSLMNISDIESFEVPLKAIIPIEQKINRDLVTPEGAGPLVNFHLLLIASSPKGYDWVLVFRDEGLKNEICRIRKGEWSRWIKAEFELKGKKIEGIFRIKLLKLSPNGERLALYRSQVYPLKGFAHPGNITEELLKICGPYLHRPFYHFPATWGWVDKETFFEECKQQTEWYAKAANYLMNRYDWDMFIMKWHGLDHLKHGYWGFIDPSSPFYDGKKAEEYWNFFIHHYELVDEMIGHILKAIDKERTLVTVISDHGHIASGLRFINVNEVLENRNLLKFKDKTGEEVDWSRTKAFDAGNGNVYINLKEREPDGLVPKEDYERVREDVIEALRSIKDPKTGKHPIIFVLGREDAIFFGLGGERVGDVIYALKPSSITEKEAERLKENTGIWGEKITGSTHGVPVLPTYRHSIGDLAACFLISGPGVKKGYKRSKPIWLRDVAPTLAYLLKLPAPSSAEGAILWDIMVHF